MRQSLTWEQVGLPSRVRLIAGKVCLAGSCAHRGEALSRVVPGLAGRWPTHVILLVASQSQFPWLLGGMMDEGKDQKRGLPAQHCKGHTRQLGKNEQQVGEGELPVKASVCRRQAAGQYLSSAN